MDEDQSIAIKEDGLAGLAVFGDKKEEGTGEEFKVHFLDDDAGKGIMAFPHVHIIGIKKNGVLRIKNHEANCRPYEINRLGRAIRPMYILTNITTGFSCHDEVRYRVSEDYLTFILFCATTCYNHL